MWEKPRQDGKIKLKRNAIPTLFGKEVTQANCNMKKGTYNSLMFFLCIILL